MLRNTPKRNMVVGPSSLGNEVPSNELVVKVVKEAAAGESVEARLCHGGIMKSIEATLKLRQKIMPSSLVLPHQEAMECCFS